MPRKERLPWDFRLVTWIFLLVLSKAVGSHAKNNEKKERLSAVIEAFSATDPLKEQSLFCKGRCHLAKVSHRFTSFDIENMGAKTLLDVLNHFPSIWVSRNNLGWPSLGIDGVMGQNRLQILIDGMRQNDPFDGQAFLSLPAFVIDFIDVYYGPGGTWFGEGSLIGVVAVTTKQMPEIRQFSYFGSDKSIGSGMLAAIKRNRFKMSAFASFSALHQGPGLNFATTNSSQGTDLQKFTLKDIFTSGFIEAKISNSAQVFAWLRSTFIAEEYGPSSDSLFAHASFGQRKIGWLNDIHLIKKKAQKNVLDLFFSFGLFQGINTITTEYSPIMAGYKNLADHYQTVRMELGGKFHVKPGYGHDVFLGLGAVLEGTKDGTHILSNNLSKPTRSFPMEFLSPASFLYSTSCSHIYGFLQDEWQIKSPLILTMGSRLLLPIKHHNSSFEFLPNIGMALIPISKLRLKIAYQTSLRSPTFYEQSDRLYDAVADKLPNPLLGHALSFEKSDTIELFMGHSDILANAQFKNSLTMHLSKLTDAIMKSPNIPLNSRRGVYLGGMRFINEVTFAAGHSFALAISYAKALPGMPRLLLKANISFDLLSFGGLNLANVFASMSEQDDMVTHPYSLFEATYLSKPAFRYLVFFLTIKNAFGGHRQRLNATDLPPADLFLKGFFAAVGLTISI